MKLTAGEWFMLKDMHRLPDEWEDDDEWSWTRDANPRAGGWLRHPEMPPIYLPETSSVFVMVEKNHGAR